MNHEQADSDDASRAARGVRGFVSRIFGARDDVESSACAMPLLSPIASGVLLRERFEIVSLLRQDPAVNRYLAKDELTASKALIIESLLSNEDGDETDSATVESDDLFPADTEDLGEVASHESVDELADDEPVELSDQDKETVDDFFECISDASLASPVALEKRIILSMVSPSVPRVIGSFAHEDRSYLALEWMDDRTLREAWRSPETTELDRVDWLIQLCRLLTELHVQDVLHNGITPDTVLVDDSGVVMLPDFRLARRLPLLGSVESTIYTAPELIIEPGRADLRADLYSIGATWYALLLGRDLEPDDFVKDFLPRPYSHHQPDADPLLVRLLLKTFSRNPEQRFPSDERRRKGDLGIAELEEQLQLYRKCLSRCAFVTGAQTSIGVYRSSNEDNFFVEKMTIKLQDEMLVAVLIILADGMGGQEAGEIASEITVNSIRDELSVQLVGWPWMADSYQRAIPDAIRTAIANAHNAVHRYADHYPERRGLGCTVDVVVCLGFEVFIGHVGDSRVGLVNQKGEFSWLTEDQTIVQRLVRLGVLQAEDAATHPERSVLYQAIGGYSDIYPDSCAATLKFGEQLICCSDGLNSHVSDGQIGEIIREARTPQRACDRLVNAANASGGTDNTTVVVVRCDRP